MLRNSMLYHSRSHHVFADMLKLQPAVRQTDDHWVPSSVVCRLLDLQRSHDNTDVEIKLTESVKILVGDSLLQAWAGSETCLHSTLE
jgi:hypothetical protein